MPAKGPEIDDEVVAAAIQRITENGKEFVRLDLQYRMMGDDAVAALCGALIKNTNLKQILPAGGKALAGMVAKNRGVEELSIGLNKIGDDAANEFIKSIAGNPVIRFIRIGKNGICDEVKQNLVKAGECRKGDPLHIICQ